MIFSRRAVAAYLILLLSAGYSVASEPVFGPPQMIVDARIDAEASRAGKRLIGTIMEWTETRQTWNVEGTIEHGTRSVRASRDKRRSIFILQAKQFVASTSTLRFARLNGEPIDSSEVSDKLRNKRAVAYLPKGAAIHPAIANALHPETVVVTKVSYSADPMVVDIPEER